MKILGFESTMVEMTMFEQPLAKMKGNFMEMTPWPSFSP